MSSSNTTKQFDGVDGDILGCSLDDYLSAPTRRIKFDELINFFHIVMEDHTWKYEHHYLRLSNKLSCKFCSLVNFSLQSSQVT